MLGLVTVLYNSNDVLEGFFKSLYLQTYKDFHLYMIDNSPSPESDKIIAELLLKYPLEVTHIKFNDNIGVAAGNNVGIKACLESKCSEILLLNNDIEFPQEGLFTDFIKTMHERSEDIIIPKILFYDSKKIWMAGGVYHKFRGYTRHIGEGKDPYTFKYNKEAYFNYAPTCFMFISAKVFQKVGFMDEKYFVYFDDTDFIFRCIKNGFKVFYLPQYFVYHKVSSSTGGYMSEFSIFYGNRNRLYFLRKNTNGLEKFLALSYYFLTRFFCFFKYNKKQNKSMWTGLKIGLKY